MEPVIMLELLSMFSIRFMKFNLFALITDVVSGIFSPPLLGIPIKVNLLTWRLDFQIPPT